MNTCSVASLLKVKMKRELIPAGLLFSRLNISGHGLLAQSNQGVANNDEDRKWALKSGLTATDIRKLRKLAGVENEADGYIDKLDSKTLQVPQSHFACNGRRKW